MSQPMLTLKDKDPFARAAVHAAAAVALHTYAHAVIAGVGNSEMRAEAGTRLKRLRDRHTRAALLLAAYLYKKCPDHPAFRGRVADSPQPESISQV